MAKTEEEAFQNDIIRVAKHYGWKVHHSRKVQQKNGRWLTPIQGDKGYVDVTLAKDGVVHHWELKRRGGRQSKEQKEWQEAMGEHYVLLDPDDWHEILRILSGGRAKPNSPWTWKGSACRKRK